MVEAVLRARGPYSLRLTAGTATWSARLPERRWASAHQLSDGQVVVRASCDRGRRGNPLRARARRRHDGVPAAARTRPTARADGAAAARDAPAAEGDRDARRRSGRSRVSSSRRARRSRSSGRSSARAARIRRHARHWRRSPPPASRRAALPRAAPRRSRDSRGDSISRSSVAATTRSSDWVASGASDRGRSGSCRCRASAGTTRGSWTTSVS